MKEDKTAVKSSAGKENEPVTENTTKKKTKEEKPPTKVVVRRLPPSMTEEQFKVQVSPMPDYDYFYFVPADMSLMPNAFSRAYINFTDQNDLFIFTQKFDGYVFVDSKGGEFPAVVEFAPFQRIPKNRPNRKKDSKVGTIEGDPIYIAFKERMEAENLENKTAVNASKQHFFETSLALDKKEEVSNTPLLDYIRNKRAERQRIREEKREEKRKKDLERRRAKEEQRRVKKEDDSSVVKNPPCPVNPSPKTNEAQLDHLGKKEKPSPKQIVDETARTNREVKITKKIREIVNFFSKSVNEIDKTESIKPADAVVPNYIKHEDVEREIINSVSDKKDAKSKQFVMTTLPSFKKFTKCNIPMTNCSFKESTVNRPSYPIPVLESRGRVHMYVPRNARNAMYTRSNSDIVMRPFRVNRRDRKEGEPDVQNFVKECEIIRPVRPIRVNVPVIPSSRRGCDAYNQTAVRTPVRVNVSASQEVRNETGESFHKRDKGESKFDVGQECKVDILKHLKNEVSVNTDNMNKCGVSPDVLKKNLQQVVANVLGNTKVNSPKENISSKPKTFVKRGVSGSGDEYRGQGFNTPNFYLPPRSFGFGLGEFSDSKGDKNTTGTSGNITNAKFPKQITSFSQKTEPPPSIPKKSLPPFSKMSASSSKSDGDIEKFGSGTKAGGSEENLRRVPPLAFVVQRPCGGLKKSLIAEKNG